MHRFTHLRRGFDLAVLASVICTTVPGAGFGGTATRTELEVVCTAPDIHLVQVRSGVHLALERAGKAPVEGKDFDIGLLSMPGCKVEPLLPSLRRAVSCGDHVTAGGDILYTGEPLGGGRRTTGGGVSFCDTPHYKKFGTEAVPVAKPSDLADPLAWSPILSDDGTAIAWIVADATSQQIRVRALATGAERSIPLGTARDRSELLAADIGVNQYLLSIAEYSDINLMSSSPRKRGSTPPRLDSRFRGNDGPTRRPSL